MTFGTPEQRVRAALTEAAGAPSSHNTQPWAVLWLRSTSVRPGGAPERLIVCLEAARCLRTLPAHRVEMLLSAGCFLEALVVSLREQGVEARCRPLTAGGGPALPLAATGWEPVAAVELDRPPSPPAPASRRGQRFTHRGAFAPQLPPRAVAAVTTVCSLAFPAARESVELTVLTAPEQLRRLGAFVARVAGRELTHLQSWAETYRFLRFRPGATEGLPLDLLFARELSAPERRVWRVLLHPRALALLAPLGVARGFGRALGRAVAASPLVLYAATRGEEPPQQATLLAAGALIQAVWMALAHEGVALHPVSVVLQHEDLRAALAAGHDLPGGYGLFFARAGVPLNPLQPALVSPRRADPLQSLRVL